MHKFRFYSLILLLTLLGVQPCHAAKLKAYVARFAVSVPENREELKTGLQTLLMSRLNSEEIQAVENQSEAEIEIAGSYIVFGTVFSLDALVKTRNGAFVDRVFVQGDTQNELIPAVSDMANRLQRALMKWNPALTAKAVNNLQPFSEAKKPLAPARAPSPPRPAPAPAPKTPEPVKAAEKPWVSQRLPDAFNGIASGKATAEGTEIFLTGEHSLGYYLRGEKLQLLSEVTFAANENVIGVDVADLDQNGVMEIFVTVLKDGQPDSKVYVAEDKNLRKIGDNLPYMLRGIALDGNRQKIFAQKIDAAGNFSGDIYELAKSGDKFTVKNPFQLPLFGTLYNFNRFNGAKGGRLFVVAHPEGYLLVYSKDKKQLWKSREKFGGKETFECQSQSINPNAPLHTATACSFSPTQRLLVTRNGDIVVSRNTGLTTNGSMRNYSKNSVVQLTWNGSSLQEKWRSEQSQNYLADFSCDDKGKELLLLEVEPKTDPLAERGSRLLTRKLK